MYRVSALLLRLTAVDLYALEQRGSIISYQLWSDEVMTSSFQRCPAKLRAELEERAVVLATANHFMQHLEDLYQDCGGRAPHANDDLPFHSATSAAAVSIAAPAGPRIPVNPEPQPLSSQDGPSL